MKTLEVQHITKSFLQGTEIISVLDNVSVTFFQGTSYAITGASGTGKSTLLYCMTGLESLDAGRIVIDGHPLTTANKQQQLRDTFGIIFQAPYLMGELTVLENVMLKGVIAGMQKSSAQEKGRMLLERVGLAAYTDANIHALSGGQQQRVAIARALFLDPLFLLADEPTAHLDDAHKYDIVRLLRSCIADYNIGIIINTHDQDIAAMMDSRFVLEHGNLTKIEHGI
jgi:ABC-type lipoprotein export system ATPase subunit